MLCANKTRTNVYIFKQEQPVAKKVAKPVAKPTPKPVAKKPEVKKPEPVAKPVSAIKPTVKQAIQDLKKESKKSAPPKEIKPIKTSVNTSVKYQPDFTKSVLDKSVEEKPQGPMVRYSDADLVEFKELIQRKHEAAKKELNYLQGLITRKDDQGGDVTRDSLQIGDHAPRVRDQIRERRDDERPLRAPAPGEFIHTRIVPRVAGSATGPRPGLGVITPSGPLRGARVTP